MKMAMGSSHEEMMQYISSIGPTEGIRSQLELLSALTEVQQHRDPGELTLEAAHLVLIIAKWLPPQSDQLKELIEHARDVIGRDAGEL